MEKIIEEALANMEGHFSIILKDLQKGRLLYARDADRVVPSASVIKVLILAEAFRQVMSGRLNLYQKLCVSDEDRVEFSLISEMDMNLYSLNDLLILMMTISDNTATNVLIDLLGMDNINDMAVGIGLKDTALKRKMMDFEAAKAGRQNVTSPQDMLCLFEKLYHEEILTPEYCRRMLNIMSIMIEKDLMTRYLPSDIRVAHKTGELDNLNHDIGIVFLENKTYLLGIFATDLQDNIVGREHIARLSRVIYDSVLINKDN